MKKIEEKKKEYMVLTSRKYSIEQCRINFDTLFIFGDNEMREGMGGQAIIREQKNAIGIVTKKRPSMRDVDFFTDLEYEKNCKLIDEDIIKVRKYAEEIGAKALGFSFYGIGTGLSSMQTNCPKTFCYLTMRLLDEFGFNNLASLRTPQ